MGNFFYIRAQDKNHVAKDSKTQNDLNEDDSESKELPQESADWELLDAPNN